MFLHVGTSENVTYCTCEPAQNCTGTSVHSNEKLHMVYWIDSLGHRNCILPTGTMTLISRLVSHKGDKVPCCLSPQIIKKKACTFLISVIELRDQRIPVDYLTAH